MGGGAYDFVRAIVWRISCRHSGAVNEWCYGPDPDTARTATPAGVKIGAREWSLAQGTVRVLQFYSPRSGRSFGFPQLLDFGACDRRGSGAKSRDHVV